MTALFVPFVAPIEEGADYDIIRNVKRCTCCGGRSGFGDGRVDRFIQKGTGRMLIGHFFGTTIYFKCRDCGAVGDPFIGMMTPFLPWSEEPTRPNDNLRLAIKYERLARYAGKSKRQGYVNRAKRYRRAS